MKKHNPKPKRPNNRVACAYTNYGRAVKRAELRWNGAHRVLTLLARGCPNLDAGSRGAFVLQQKFGI